MNFKIKHHGDGSSWLELLDGDSIVIREVLSTTDDVETQKELMMNRLSSIIHDQRRCSQKLVDDSHDLSEWT